MTFMSRKISNDLENMGATAGNTLATKCDKAKCELFSICFRGSCYTRYKIKKKSQSISKQCRNFMLVVFTFSAGKPPRHP